MWVVGPSQRKYVRLWERGPLCPAESGDIAKGGGASQTLLFLYPRSETRKCRKPEAVSQELGQRIRDFPQRVLPLRREVTTFLGKRSSAPGTAAQAAGTLG